MYTETEDVIKCSNCSQSYWKDRSCSFCDDLDVRFEIGFNYFYDKVLDLTDKNKTSMAQKFAMGYTSGMTLDQIIEIYFTPPAGNKMTQKDMRIFQLLYDTLEWHKENYDG